VRFPQVLIGGGEFLEERGLLLLDLSEYGLGSL
jgi:hypothetical protein